MVINWRKKLWFVKKDVFLTSAVKTYEYASDDFYNLTFQTDEKNMEDRMFEIAENMKE